MNKMKYLIITTDSFLLDKELTMLIQLATIFFCSMNNLHYNKSR